MTECRLTDAGPDSAPRRRDLVVAFLLRRLRGRHGRPVVRGGAALFLVLPHHRLRRHHPGGEVAADAHASGRIITVRFDSNVAAGLPWRFEPERRTIDVKLGQVVTVYYTVTNESARVTAGQAGYNVSPPTVGIYFEKINCFCFTEQTMQPGEKRDMAVVFYVDPKLAKDSEQDDVKPLRCPIPSIRSCAGTAGGGEFGAGKDPARSDEQRQGAQRARPANWRDDDGRRTCQTASRLPPGQSQPVAGDRRHFGICHRGRIDHLDAPYSGLRADHPRRRRHRHRLHHDRLVARCHPRSRSRTRPYPRGADFAPLRHDPVHRLGGDVLRRLVLGLFQHRAVPGRAQGCRRVSAFHRRRVAAEGHRRRSIPGICRC